MNEKTIVKLPRGQRIFHTSFVNLWAGLTIQIPNEHLEDNQSKECMCIEVKKAKPTDITKTESGEAQDDAPYLLANLARDIKGKGGNSYRTKEEPVGERMCELYGI